MELVAVNKMARKIQVCFTMDEELHNELKAIKKETGLPLSKIIELRLKGYIIIKRKNEKEWIKGDD